jgi:hypothetical protein
MQHISSTNNSRALVFHQVNTVGYKLNPEWLRKHVNNQLWLRVSGVIDYQNYGVVAAVLSKTCRGALQMAVIHES